MPDILHEIIEAVCKISEETVTFRQLSDIDGKVVSKVPATKSDREMISDNAVSAASDGITELEETSNFSDDLFPDVHKDETVSPNSKLKCFVCGKCGYNAMKFLKQHWYKHIHGFRRPNHKVRNIVCIEQCGGSFGFMKAYRKHLAQKHNIENVNCSENLLFYKMDDFYKWLQSIEVSDRVHYVKYATDMCKKGYRAIFYRCNHSRRYKSSSVNSISLGVNRIGFVCASSIYVRFFYEDKIYVNYYSRHYKHEMPVLHLPIKIAPELQEITGEMETVINNALIPDPPDEMLSSLSQYQVIRKDINTLSGSNWLNDEIINFYLALIVERGKLDNYPTVYAINSFLYPKLKEKGYTGVKCWTNEVDIFSFDLILIPIHLGNHWCLAVIDFQHKSIQYYDSMGGSDNCLLTLKNYLTEESLDKKGKEFDLSGWHTEVVKKDMPYFRRLMVYEIMTKKLF